MANDISFIYDLIGDFWRDVVDQDLYEDIVWRTAVDWGQDARMHTEQVGDSKAIISCPTLMEHTWLYREGTGWVDTGGFHQHAKYSFLVTSLSGQKEFLFSKPIVGNTGQVWIDGKLLSDKDDFILRADKLEFAVAIPVGSLLTVVADELLRTTISSTSITLSSLINDLRAVLRIDTWDISSQVNLITTSTGDTLELKGSSWLKGELLLVDDGTSSEYVTVTTSGSSVLLQNTYVGSSLTAFRVIDTIFSKSSITMEDTRLKFGIAQIPPSVPIQVSDAKGRVTITTSETTSVISLPRTFDINTLEVRILGGSVYNYDITSLSFITPYSFSYGVVAYLEAPSIQEHGHVKYTQEITELTSFVTVTSPFKLSVGLTELDNFPIKVYIDGVLLHTSQYRLMSNYRVQFWDPLTSTVANLNAGIVTVMYTVDYNKRYHVHELHWMEAVNTSSNNFSLTTFGDSTVMPQEFYLDGYLREYFTFADKGKTLSTTIPVPTGTVIQANMLGVDFKFYRDTDKDVTEEYFLDNNIAPATLVKAEHLRQGIEDNTVDLPWVEPDILPLVSGFTIRFIKAPSYVRVYSDVAVDHIWLKDCYIDEKTLYNNFGAVLGLNVDSSVYMRNTIMAFVEALWKGSQEETLTNFANIVFGSPFTIDGDEKFLSYNYDTILTDKNTYTVNPDIPVRVPTIDKVYKNFAWSLFVSEVNPEPYLAPLAQNYSPDYSIARRMDHKEDSTIIGAGTAYIANGYLSDTSKNFVSGLEGEVWVGDIIEITDSVGVRSSIITSLSGETDIYYTPVSPALASPTQYKIYCRHTVRLDDGSHLDKALEVTQVNRTLAPIFEHLRVYKLEVAALIGSYKQQENLDLFLDKALPAWESHEIICEITLDNTTDLSLPGGEVTPEEEANWLVLGMSPIEGGSIIGGALL